MAIMAMNTFTYNEYQGRDGEYAPLLAFAREAVRHLIPNFDPPARRWAEWQDSTWSPRLKRGWKEGDEARGFAVTLASTEAVNIGTDDHGESTETVEVYGLEVGQRLEIKSVREGDDPRFLELNVCGPDEAVQNIAALFAKHFGHLGRDEPPNRVLREDLQAAKIAVRFGDWSKAIRRAERVHRYWPNDSEAVFCLAVAYGATGDLPKATALLEQLTARDPRDSDAWYNLGNCYLEQGQPTEALRALKKALELSPHNHAVLYQLGNAYEQAGDVAEAIKAFKDCVRTSPNPRGAWHYTGKDFTESARAALARLAPKEMTSQRSSAGR